MSHQHKEDFRYASREVVPGQLGYRQMSTRLPRRVQAQAVVNRPLMTRILLFLLAIVLLFAIVITKVFIHPPAPQLVTSTHVLPSSHSFHSAPSPTPILTPTPTLSPQSMRIASQIDGLLTHEVAQQQFSGSVLIAQNDQVLLSKGYSMADWNHLVPNTPHTKFYLGSSTKQFTAMAILLLQQQGKLHVHDPLCSYIPQCPAAWQPVTIHEVLTHTSGIPQLDDANLSYTSPQAWIGSFDAYPLVYTPGAEYSYCSICYQILGYIVEQVLGEPYSTFLQQTIFDPLQMSNTGFDTHYPILPDHAVGYASWQVQDIPITWDVTSEWSFLFGSGLLYSTVEDLYRWDQALYTDTLLSLQALNEAFTPFVASQYSGSSYGYGWFISQASTPGHQLIWHDGRVNGFRTYIGRYINDHVTIIILSNLSTFDEFALASTLQQMIFGHA